jgi:tight adherence protein B
VRFGGRVAACLAGLLLIAAGPAQLDTPDVDFVDVRSFPTMRVVFTPPDGAPDGLTIDDVSIAQDGELLEYELDALDTEPVEVVLLIDASGSMAGAPMAAAREAALGFVDVLPPGSDIAVVAFGTAPETVSGFGTSLDELTNAISQIQPEGETAVHDAVIHGVGVLEEGPRDRQFLVLLSDGADTASTGSLDDALTSLASIEVGFYAIELRGSEFDPAALQSMAEAAGGRVIPASDAEALAGAYTEIAEELVSQYILEFEPLHGGETTFSLTVATQSGDATRHFDLSLPPFEAPVETPTEVVETPVPVTLPEGLSIEITPPRVRIVDAPGLFQTDWALTSGLALMFIVLMMTFGMALRPQGRYQRRRGSQRLAEEQTEPFEGTTSLLSRLGSAVQTRMRARAAERESGLARALDAAGVALKVGEFVVLTTLLAMAGVAVGLLLGNLVLAALLGASVLGMTRLWLRSKADARRKQFTEQLEGTLQLIAGSLRAGYGVNQAINTVANEAEEPTAGEFSRVVAETRLGRDLDDSLAALADRMQNVDFEWVIDAIAIQRSVGGDLAEVLDTVGRTIRDRNHIRRQVQALSAEGRMSAFVLISLPFAIAGLISVTNPEYLSELTTTTVGRVILLVCAVLMGIGIAWIRKIVRIVF